MFTSQTAKTLKNEMHRLRCSLDQWLPTPGLRIGAGPRKFFAGSRSILFSAKIIFIWNHNHCKDVTLCKTYFTPGDLQQ